jgi:transposase InsO family protein
MNGGRYLAREQARPAVLDHVETYYNSIRRHSALDQIRPAAFEIQNTAQYSVQISRGG